MKALSLGVAVAMTACVTTTEPPLDELDQDVIGGQTTTTATFPTVVALQQGSGNWFCSGVLVDKDWVLTAASCFDNNNAVQVRIGDNNLTDGTVAGLTITAAEIHKHPSFNINSSTWIHDVAVIKLAQSVTDRTPTTIHRDPMSVGTSFTQVGFGVNNDNGNGGGVLRSLTTSNVDCATAGDAGISNTNVLCFDASDGTGSCYGDGGAPALIGSGSREVVGLASGGTGNSCTSGLDIYTALSAELAFIDTYVPHTDDPTQPPPPPPAGDPDADPPPDGGARDPQDPSDPGGSSGSHAVGCDAGGGSGGWLIVLAMVGAVGGIRRRRAR